MVGFFKRHSILSGIIVSVLFTIPSAINTWWDLYQKYEEAKMPPINLGLGIWLLPLVGVILAIVIIWQGRRTHKSRVIQIKSIYEEDKGFDNGERVSECGLIFTNSSSTNLTNCQARLIDLEYETPHEKFGLQSYPKAEELVCDESVPAFSTAKIPLFRWKGNALDNKLDIVYQSKNEHANYGVANTPILLLLNIWSENVSPTFVVCKLAKGQWIGFDLSIVKTGSQKDILSLATFQKPIQNKED